MSRSLLSSNASRFLALAGSFAILLSSNLQGFSQTPKPSIPAKVSPKPKADEHGINAQFADPDVQAFVKRFETDSREVFARRNEIVRAMGIKRGMAVADIGAGTGLFTRLIAEDVGAEGRVYAVDISPAFLKHIDAESKRLNQKQVRTIKGSQETTGLPANSIDLAFMCDVYHHLEHPMATLRTIHDALKKDGEFIVIDFDRVKGKSTEFVLKHVRADKAVFIKEIQSAGFLPIPSTDVPRLSENFFLRFRKVSKAPTGPDGD